jgi:hypothetical protein
MARAFTAQGGQALGATIRTLRASRRAVSGDVDATFENVRRDSDSFVYELGRSKTNQRGRRDTKDFQPIQGAAAQALRSWIEVFIKLSDHRGGII